MLLHSFTLATITFLPEKSNSDLCCKDLYKGFVKLIQSTAQDRFRAVLLFFRRW
jgi:hypothetical protein